MRQLIIEGLTGAGKSSVIATLKDLLPVEQWNIIYEDDTLGEVMSELADPNTNYDKCYRLRQVMERMKNESGQYFLLERFHPSYYALMPDWDLYKEIDEQLAQMNFLFVLLHYDEELLEKRAVRHADLKKAGGSDNTIGYWGSLEAAISAYKNSQGSRFECLELTGMDHIQINTTEMKWKQYADEIIRHIGFTS